MKQLFIKTCWLLLLCYGVRIFATGHEGPYGCQSNTVILTTALYSPQKYQGIITQVIDKYVKLCMDLERMIGHCELGAIRQLVFTHPCIIRCYNEISKQKSVKPLAYLWRTYKNGAVTNEKPKFIYEFCHLISLIFEQFLIKLTTDLTGQSVQSLSDLLDKLQIDLPLDDLIDVLEQCYGQLSLVVEQLSVQQHLTKMRKVVLVILVIAIVVTRKVYQYLKPNLKPTLVEPLPMNTEI